MKNNEVVLNVKEVSTIINDANMYCRDISKSGSSADQEKIADATAAFKKMFGSWNEVD